MTPGPGGLLGQGGNGLLGALLQGLGLYNALNSQQPAPTQPSIQTPPIGMPVPPYAPTPISTKPSAALSVSPNSIPVNGVATLTWFASRAEECVIQRPDQSILARGGPEGKTETGNLTVTTIFMLTCAGNDGSRSISEKVYVGEPAPASKGTTQPAPTLPAATVMTGTSGATSAGPAQSGSGQNTADWCDPAVAISAFISCLNGLPK